MTLLRGGAATDVGRVRQVNQDLALTSPSLFAVADGMGGHAGGEVAAQIAVDTLERSFTHQPTTRGLATAVTEANRAVWSESQQKADLRGMGTTLTAAALVAGGDGRDVVALANVGDSRAYLFSGGRMTQVTADHSLAEEKVRLGEMTEAQAAVHPHRHILTRALGVAPDVDVDLWELHVRSGDRILLCSDGLTNEVGVNEIAAVLDQVTDPTEAAASLVRTANEHGGNDNITVVVVDVLVGEEGGTATVIAPVDALGAAAVVLASDAAADATSPDAPTSALPRDAGGPGLTGPEPPGSDLTGVVPRSGADAAASETAAVPVPADAGLTGVLPSTPPASGDLFLSGQRGRAKGSETAATTSAGAVGTATATVATPTRPTYGSGTVPTPMPVPPGPESRGQRRRRLGIPRPVTFRVVVFFLLVVALLVGAYALVRWYANENWYVTLDKGELVIYQGQPGGLLWFKPKVVDRTGVNIFEIPAVHLAALEADVNEPSLRDAKDYVSRLQEEYQAEQAAATTTSVPAGGVGPSGTLPTLPPPTTAPPTTTTPAPVPAAATTTPTTAPVTTTPTTAPVTTTTPTTAPPATTAPTATPTT